MHEKMRKWGTHTTLSQHRYLHLHHDFQHNIIGFAKSLLFTSIRGTLCRGDRVSCARPLTNNSQPTVAASHISKVQDDLNVHHTHSTTLPAMTPHTSRGVAPPIFHEWVVAWQATPAQHTELAEQTDPPLPQKKTRTRHGTIGAVHPTLSPKKLTHSSCAVHPTLSPKDRTYSSWALYTPQPPASARSRHRKHKARNLRALIWQ